MSHRERAPEREEGARGEDVAPLALLPQLLESERSISIRSSALPSAFLFEKTQPRY